MLNHIIDIGGKKIGKTYPVFIIAEAGVNYNNNLSLAYKMVDVAVSSGVDAIKFQTFITDELQLKDSTKPKYQHGIRHKSYYEIIKELEPSFQDHVKISKYCRKKNIIFLSTPGDLKSVDLLSELDIPAYKIASSDLTNHILLEKIARKRKPILLSTGLSSMRQVESAIQLLKKFHMERKTILLQATSNYPTRNEEVNLRVITEYYRRFNCLVGFSDHTLDHTASLGAVALGACVIERHFTLNKKLSGPDQSSSLNPYELKEWVTKIRLMEKSLGSAKKSITNSEIPNLSMRKSIVITSAKKNSVLTRNLLHAMRGKELGVLPLQENINKILGKKLRIDIKEPKQFSWKMVK